LFTGQGREEVAVKALNLGADRYVNKIGKPKTVFGELAHSIRQKADKKRVEKQLRVLSSVVEQSSSSIVVLDNEEKIVYVNPKFLSLHDMRFADIVGKQWQPWVADGTPLKEEKEDIRNTVFKHKTIWSKDIYNVVSSGETIWRRATIFPLIDTNNKVTHVVYTGEDITKQRKTEQTVWEREEHLRAIVASSPDSMIVTDVHGNITDCNTETLNLLEFSSKADILRKDYYDLIVTEDQPKVRGSIKELFKSGSINRFECSLVTASGLKIPVEYSASILRDSNGNPVGAIGLARDITERKKMEQELKESEEKYRKQFEEVLDAIFLADAETGVLVDCNRAAAELVGRDKSELIGQPQRILHPAENRSSKFSKVFADFLKNKPNFQESQVVTKTGEIRDVVIRASSFKLGNKTLVQGIFRDMTEQKQMERDLQQSEEKYRSMIEQAPDAIFTFDLSGTVTSCNQAGLAFTGFPESELVGKTFAEFVPLVDSSKELFGLYNFLFAGGVPEPFQVSFLTNSGEPFFGEVHTSLLKQGDKISGFQAIVRDITERKKAEEALRESEKRFRELSEMLPEVIFEADFRGVISFVNHEAYNKFGYSQEEFENGLTTLQMIAPSDQERVQNNFGKLIHGEETGPNEYLAVRKDGVTFPMIVNSTPIIRDDRVVGIRGIMVDLTEHMKTEEVLKETLTKLETLNEKLGVVGRLTRHDTRNKLSVILNNVYLAKQQLPDSSANECLQEIESAVDQIEKIFEFSRMYQKLGTEDLFDVDVKKSLDEAFMLASRSGEVELVNECSGLTVKADSLLRQVFYNLIDNSLKHGEKVTKIRVCCKEGRNNLNIVYEDDGVGIAEDEKTRIFEEGYGKGTGYGLYLIQKTCEVYGWSIEETGQAGKGAQFTITIDLP
jgi:PAS domain S-box-containing protein